MRGTICGGGVHRSINQCAGLGYALIPCYKVAIVWILVGIRIQTFTQSTPENTSLKLIVLLKMHDITVDVLVCGGGMSGMACASFAAQAGARVLVVEKQSTVGGSSNYSAGMLYVSCSSIFTWRIHNLRSIH